MCPPLRVCGGKWHLSAPFASPLSQLDLPLVGATFGRPPNVRKHRSNGRGNFGKPKCALPYGFVGMAVKPHRRRSAKSDRAGDQRSPLRVCGEWVFCTVPKPQHGFRRKCGCSLSHSSLAKVLERGLRGKLLSRSFSLTKAPAIRTRTA